jgi:hypothetical protein
MPFRVLTLDGGGAWALIEVRALMKLYGDNATGHEILKNFDLVAANSGGAIVAAGLVEDLALSEIAEYFLNEDNRRSIFSPSKKPLDAVFGPLGLAPKYSASAKLTALQKLIPETGDKPVAGILDGIAGPGGKPVHLLVGIFDYDQNRAVFFRSAVAGAVGDWGEGQPANATLAESVHASTNAPVLYFDAPADLPRDPDEYWDGAITGCNNPTVVALTESIVLGQDAHSINVLSLGTGSVSLPLAAPGGRCGLLETPRARSSTLGDLTKLAGAILDDPPDAATFIAHVITGGKPSPDSTIVSRIVRMSPLVSPTPMQEEYEYWLPAGWTVDDFLSLTTTGMDAVVQTDIERIDRYATSWLASEAPNQAIRANGSKFNPWAPEIGYAKFSEAESAWKELFPVVADEGAA